MLIHYNLSVDLLNSAANNVTTETCDAHWIWDTFAVLVKALPLVLHIMLVAVLSRNRKRYLSDSFYVLIFLFSVIVIIETSSSLLAMLLENKFKIVYHLLNFLEYLTDAYTPCIIFLMGLVQAAMFSEGFLHRYLLKIDYLLINALFLLIFAFFWSLTVTFAPYVVVTELERKAFNNIYSIVTCIFHLLPVLSFTFYLYAYFKICSFNNSTVLPVLSYTCQRIMRAEKINLIQGFLTLMAYMVSISFDFMEGYVVDWYEYPANIVREVAEGVAGVAVPVMVFMCAKHIRIQILSFFSLTRLYVYHYIYLRCRVRL